ncbi:dihydrofolate reductase family protein [Thermomonospora catenispora]|uniref:dihydrofolate reductase family protein n=1 Tax=Thermomonospora catenispora TaxID=2493090 RepID=UPI001122833A|nr:dihydrofolate reductase family protein [Thermomonospora catenispora]TNY38398.1 dihydrofolate reductase [Thermomonospora catenispora]
MRRLVYYVGMSIDGFIAGPGGEVDFFPVTPDVVEFIREDYPDALPTHVREQLGVDADNRRFDTVIQGRRTYEPALEIGVTSPYAHLRQYVASGSLGESPDPAVEIVSGDPLAKIRELKAEEGRDIYLAGGARLAGALLPEIDDLVVKLYPVVVGTGIPLFGADFSPVHFELTGVRPLESGMVVLTYRKKRSMR